MIGVILAGGSGTRFWPQSRERYPKQFLRVTGERTMLQSTVERILPLIPAANIFVVTNQMHAAETCRQLADYGFNPANLLAEPAGRNPAPAAGFCASMLPESARGEVMAVLPADHVVGDVAAFHAALQTAAAAAARDYLVTLGACPTRPETGYGYIKRGAAIAGLGEVFAVDKFVEKPGLETARAFLAAGGYFWNCGVFVWKADVLLAEMRRLLPELAQRLPEVAAHWRKNAAPGACSRLDGAGAALYAALPPVSIDYGIMEKSARVAMTPMRAAWNDVGAWTAMDDVKPRDAAGNVLSADVVAVDCHDSIAQGDGRLLALVGVRDLIVIDTPDALLVAAKSHAQDVKKAVEKIREQKRPEAREHASVREAWGARAVLERGDGYLARRLHIYPGAELGADHDYAGAKLWIVLAGTAEALRESGSVTLRRHESLHVPAGAGCRLRNAGAGELIVLEAQFDGPAAG